ncbi:MAG: hypothetical protein ABEJ88_09310 [Halobacterium sp.]
MAAACQTVRFVADLTMQVPRNATGDLDAGAETVVSRIDAVGAVEAVDVTDLRPRLNDLLVDATVTATVDVEDAPDVEGAAHAALADGFGVEAVEDLRVDPAAAPRGDPVQEFG